MTKYKYAGFWNFMAKNYAKSAVSDEGAYQTKLAKTQTYLTPQSNVLEFGCGTGTTALTHAPLVQRILATDFSTKMIGIAQSKADAAGITNVTFQQATLDEVRESDASFDMVMAHSILHLLPDKDAAIARTFDLLKPGGVFVSSTACIAESANFLKYVAPVGRAIGLLPYLDVFTANALLSAIKSAGFEIEHEWRPTPKSALFLVARKPV